MLMPEGPVWIDGLKDSNDSLRLEDALDEHGPAAVLDAASKFCEEIFALLDTEGHLTKVAEENLVMATGALAGAAKDIRDMEPA